MCWISVGTTEMNGKTERTEKVPELNAKEWSWKGECQRWLPSVCSGLRMDRELKEIRDRKWCFGSKQSHEIPFRLSDFEGVLRYPGADV